MIRATDGARSGRGYVGPLCTDPAEYPITDYPKYPNGGPLGDEDLPVTNNF